MVKMCYSNFSQRFTKRQMLSKLSPFVGKAQIMLPNIVRGATVATQHLDTANRLIGQVQQQSDQVLAGTKINEKLQKKLASASGHLAVAQTAAQKLQALPTVRGGKRRTRSKKSKKSRARSRSKRKQRRKVKSRKH